MFIVVGVGLMNVSTEIEGLSRIATVKGDVSFLKVLDLTVEFGAGLWEPTFLLYEAFVLVIVDYSITPKYKLYLVIRRYKL